MISHNSPQIYRKPDIKAIFSFADSTLYLHVSQGILPKPISLSSRARGWPASEIDAIVAARIAGRTEDQIKALVITMTAARQNA